MPELKELFETVTDDVEPELDAWDLQQRRQRGRLRRRRGGAIVLAASISILMIALIVRAVSRQQEGVGTSTHTPTPLPTPTASDTRLDLFGFDPATSTFHDTLRRAGDESDPEMSPDGSSIVFEGTVEGALNQIFMLDPDGEVRQLTTRPDGASDPTWSPDGRQIAFVGGGASADIYVMNDDGTDVRRLGGTASPDGGPDWSPDGTEIVFYSHADDELSSSIYTITPDEGIVTRLTRPEWADVYPDWSPNGDQIVFIRYDARGAGQLEWVDTDVWVMEADGSGQHRLLEAEGRNAYAPGNMDEFAPQSADSHFQHSPVWSPDGAVIAFTGAHCECITTIQVATGEKGSIASPPPVSLDDISWSPDGTILGDGARAGSRYFDDPG